MTEDDAPLTIKQQARRWAMESRETPALHAAAMRWCAEDPEHRREFDIADAALTNYIDPAARNVRSRQKQRHRQKLARLAMAASIAAIVLMGAHIVLGQNVSGLRAPPSVASGDEEDGKTQLVLVTGKTEVRSVALPDGSIVTLDADSRLLVSMRADRREITLDHGRAVFSVGHDKARPFVVTTDEGTTTALGTRFSVERRTKCQMNVVLYEGHVAVTPPCQGAKNVANGAQQVLQPGQRIRYTGASSQRNAAIAEPAPRNDEQWVTGVKSYDDETVAAILAEVNLYSDIKLVAATPEIAAMRVSAELHIRNSQSVARHLARSLSLTLDDQQPDRIILKK